MDIQQIVLLYVVLLVSLVVHEASHAWFALMGGDRTAYLGGQVTLNPIPHIQREPFGTVILPLLVLFMSNGNMVLGYAHAPFDPIWAHRHPRRAALMSFAGPLSNFVICAIAFAGLKALVASGVADSVTTYEQFRRFVYVSPIDGSTSVEAVVRILSAFLFLNLLLGIFNLFPWPPLDGAGVVEGLAPRGAGAFYSYVRTQPILMLLGIVGVWQVLPELFGPALVQVYNWL